MALFRYEASDARGRLERGKLEADNARGAQQRLRERSLVPLSITPAREGGGRFGPRLSSGELAWATHQLASLLAARLPLEAALGATLEQAERRHTVEVLTAIRGEVRAGQRLADALATRPRDFPEIYRALISAGEDSGDMARIMERLADYIEERNALQAKVLSAFIYPAVVTLVSIGIVVFLLSYVVPQVATAFVQARQALPWLTRVMLAASAGVRSWGAAGLLGAVGIVAGWRLAMRRPALRLAWHQRLLRFPLLGRFVLGVDTARFAATLAILIDAGVPLLRGLEAARQTLGNEALRESVRDAIARVREGAPLGSALQVQRRFPPMLIHLIASGEKTGALAPMLDRAAHDISRDIERRAMAFTALLEPLMILVMGAVVLMIVLAVLLPIMEMNQLVQ